MNAHGADISFWQDDNNTPQGVDFEKMSKVLDFVLIRVGQNDWLDPDFKTHWAGAKVAGIPRGSYWFYDSRNSPQAQALLWSQALGDDPGELPLFADFEENYGGQYAGWSKFYAFLEELKKLMPGKEIIIYTGYYYWKDNVIEKTTPAQLEYFHQYGLWIARYKAVEPLVPLPWDYHEWTFWQYTEHGDGLAYGVESLGIDLNYYNGTLDEFNARFGLGDAIPVDYDPNNPPEETEKKEWTLFSESTDFLLCRRTPDEEDANELQFYPLHESTIFTSPHVEYRNHGGNLVPNWTTEAQRLNLDAKWVRIPIQPVKKNNFDGENYKTLWTSWETTGKPWDLYGVYVLRKDLEAMAATQVEKPVTGKVIIDDLRFRDTPNTSGFIVGEFWNNGSVIPIEEERYDADGNHWVKFSAWAAAEYNGQSFIDIDDGTAPPVIDPDVPTENPSIFPFGKPISSAWNSRIDGFVKVPNQGKWVQIGTDVDNPEWSFTPRADMLVPRYKAPPDNALPLTNACIIRDDFVELTPQKQWMIFEMWVLAVGGTLTFNAQGNPIVTGGAMTLDQLKKAWLETMKGGMAYTDKHSYLEGYEDVILGKNEGSSKGYIQQKCLGSGLQILNVLSETFEYVIAKALNPNVEHTALEVLSNPAYHFWATQQCCLRKDENGIEQQTWNGINKVVPFPWLRIDGQKTGLPMPFWGKGDAFSPAGTVRVAKQGKKSAILGLADNKEKSIVPLNAGSNATPYIFVS